MAVASDGKILQPISNNPCNAQQNSLDFISRLPTEILELIFIQHAHNSFWNATCTSEWVTRVSSHWRSVVLNCPTFWSYIFTMSARRAQKFLERSGKAPLKIRLHASFDAIELPAIVKTLLSHAERVQEFRFHVGYSNWNVENSQIVASLCSGAPHLRVLEFHGVSCPPSMVYDSDILAPWHLHKLGGLTVLSLCNIPDSLQRDPSAFLAALRNMPDLVDLVLVDAIASSSDWPTTKFDALQMVNLPRLLHLLVVAPLLQVIVILSGIHIPVRTKVKVNCKRDTDYSCRHYDRLCYVLAQNYDRVPSFPVRSVILDCERLKLTLIMSTEPDFKPGYFFAPHGSMDCWKDDILLEIVVELTVDEGMFEAKICTSLPRTNVQTFRITDPPCNPAFWRRTLGHFRELRCLRLSDGIMGDGLASVLLHNTDDEYAGDQTGSRMVVPMLEKLELYSMQLLTGYRIRDRSRKEPDTNTITEEHVQSLCTALVKRKSRGQLTMALCVASDRYSTTSIDMAGWLDDGRFYVERKAITHRRKECRHS